MITNVAITATSTMMRMLRGMTRRMLDMAKLENATTRVKAILMTMAVLSCTVTAKAEQIPNICLEIGFASQSARAISLNEVVFRIARQGRVIVPFILISLRYPGGSAIRFFLNLIDTGS